LKGEHECECGGAGGDVGVVVLVAWEREATRISLRKETPKSGRGEGVC